MVLVFKLLSKGKKKKSIVIWLSPISCTSDIHINNNIINNIIIFKKNNKPVLSHIWRFACINFYWHAIYFLFTLKISIGKKKAIPHTNSCPPHYPEIISHLQILICCGLQPQFDQGRVGRISGVKQVSLLCYDFKPMCMCLGLMTKMWLYTAKNTIGI